MVRCPRSLHVQMFVDRNRETNGVTLGQMAWAGEFAGKWLTHAVQLYRLAAADSAERASLGDSISEAVAFLAEVQAPDGYLGPNPDTDRWGSDAQSPRKVGGGGGLGQAVQILS